MTTPENLQQQVNDLESKNRTLGTRNAKLVQLLRETRNQLQALREDFAEMTEPPSTYGTFLEVSEGSNGRFAEVHTGNRRMRLNVHKKLPLKNIQPGALVRIAEGNLVVEDCGFTDSGDLAEVKDVLFDGKRALVVDRTGEEFVIRLAGKVLEQGIKPGQTLLIDRKSGHAFEVIPKAEVEQLVLEEIPDVEYADIGGLEKQISEIHDAVELPFLHPELYAAYNLRPPKGVLLYGPPGNGKTLIAKAVANSLATKMAEARGESEEVARNARSYFLNVKGPELLNKYVGETERQIRLIFERAREIAEAGKPVIVFFDEMDSIFRTRGSGISSDMENTVVPQLLAEIDGVEGLENVIVIGASNREEMIDPAILRPGRLDIKIRIDRPNAVAAREIFSKYLTDKLPYAPAAIEAAGSVDALVNSLIDEVVDAIYTDSPDNEYVELTYADGSKEMLYHSDLNSGAMISNIVDRAKKFAIKDVIAGRGEGVTLAHLLEAVAKEFAEGEDLPNTSNPDEWAKISGRTFGRVTDVRVVQH